MKDYTGFEIAVIGMCGRFPGAGDVQTFWKNLAEGKESITFLSDEELLSEGESQRNLDNPRYVRANSFIEDKGYFDSNFFGYLPIEARLMDPQMRILHECVWKVIEDAGYDLERVKERIGLFTGAKANLNWEGYAIMENADKEIDDFSAEFLRDINNSNTKISYLLNLRGPSVAINTACSTSLVAIQMASNSLLLGECNMAIAGGVTIYNYSKRGYIHEEGMINSQDGHVRPFDATSSGVIGGEGAGVVLLKKYKNAVKDGDNILAVIRGTGINNDGNDKVGYTAPSVNGQTEAIMMAHKMARIDPKTITYVEAHGTSTKLGDPIEIEALTRAFGKSTNKYCAVGSVKGNIGHLDAAAGITGLIKTVLAMQHKQLPPSINFESPNPNINFEQSPFYVNAKLSEWKNGQFPRRAGVSSFGIGGTNAHILLEEAPKRAQTSVGRRYNLLPVSAKTTDALARNVDNLKTFLSENRDINLADVAYTLQLGRSSMEYRQTVVCKDHKDAIEQLSALTQKEAVSEKPPTLVCMFSGQGAQYIQMGRDLYDREPFFREQVDRCLQIARRFTDLNLKEALFPTSDENAQWINQTAYTQPLLFTIEYALAKLILQWGIQPDVLTGHSVGEFAAACISGLFSLEDAMKLIVHRGRLMQGAPHGKMLSVQSTEEALEPLLKDHPGIALAAINSSQKCVLAGSSEAIAAFQLALDEMGWTSKAVRTSHAFHSPMMDGILEDFRAVFTDIRFQPMQIPLLSNLYGRQLTQTEAAQAEYWVQHLRQPVRFAEGIEHMLTDKPALFIEVGPGKTLTSFVASHQKRTRMHQMVNLMRHPKEGSDDQQQLLKGMGKIWESGIRPDWKALYTEQVRRRVSLPTYSFEKTAFPVLVDAFQLISDVSGNVVELKRSDRNKWFYAPVWKLAPRSLNSLPEGAAHCTLLIGQNASLSTMFEAQLSARDEQLVSVVLGQGFEVKGDWTYVVNPANESDFLQLYEALSVRNIQPTQMIHAGGIGEVESTATYDTYFYSLVYAIKAHQQTYRKDFFEKIVLLTSALQDVYGEQALSPVKALPLNLLKVVSQEHPDVQVSCIDLPVSETYDQRLIQQIQAEMHYGLRGRVLAFRDGRRWELGYDGVPTLNDETYPCFRKGGVYLITGGLGDLGYTVAESLLKKFDAKVILLGRTALPTPEKWAEQLAEGKLEEKITGKIEKLLALQQCGGELLYKAADVANLDDMQQVVQSCEHQFGPVQGVIHASGVISGFTITTLNELKRKDFETQLSPKIKGLEVLVELFGARALDFCVVTSSLSAVLGGHRLGAYAPANAIMDQYILSKRNQGLLKNWISIDFDGLNFEGYGDSNVIEGSEIFETINRSLSIREHFSQILVSTTDLHSRLHKWLYDTEEPEEESDVENFDLSEAQDADEADGLSPVERKLIQMWQGYFGRTDLRPADDFFDIGGDSLKALTMIQRIQKVFNVQLTVAEFFDKSAITEMAKFIEAQLWLTEQDTDAEEQNAQENKIEIII